MESALQLEPERLYTRHVAATDRGSWSLISDVRWGDIDARKARAQPDTLETLRRLVLALSRRGAAAARLLSRAADDPHASAALTLELWNGLKHVHALRTYLDSVDGPRVSDADLAEVRSGPDAPAETSFTEAFIGTLFLQHAFAAAVRHLGARAEEPVLAELLSLIAADDFRSGQVGLDLMALRLAGGRTTAAEVRSAVERERKSVNDWPADDLTAQNFTRRMEELCEQAAPDAIPRASPSP